MVDTNTSTHASAENTAGTNGAASAKPVKKTNITAKPHVALPKAKAKKATAKPAKKVAKKAAATKKITKPVKKSAKKSVRTADNFDRNFGRIRFNGESLSKGRAVHAVIAAFVEKKKPTAAALKTAFPDELLKNYGIVREIGSARKYNVNGKSRYFTNSEDQIKTKDGKSFAVCNQFSTENIKPFIKHAKTLGFTMTAGK